jgi:hypothetical protein
MPNQQEEAAGRSKSLNNPKGKGSASFCNLMIIELVLATRRSTQST